MAIFYSSLGKLVQSYLYLCYQDEEIEVERGKVFFKVHSYRPAEMRFRSGPVSFWRLRSLWRQDPPRGPQRETSSGSQCKLGRIQMLSPYMRMPTHWIWGRAMFADKHPGGLRYSVAVKDGTEGWSFHPAWMPTLKIQIMQYRRQKQMNPTSRFKAELSIFFMGISPMLLCHKRVNGGREEKYMGWF